MQPGQVDSVTQVNYIFVIFLSISYISYWEGLLKSLTIIVNISLNFY